MIDLRLFAYVFGVIFVAELPDKTALAALVLATRHKPLPVVLGAGLALTIQSVIAVAAGGLISRLPARMVHVGAGVVFLSCAVMMWRRKEEGEADDLRGKLDDRAGFWRALWTVFGVVFIAEWGDLTQVGTAAFAARYRAGITIFFAATCALWCVVLIAVFVGNRAARVLDPRRVQRIAAVLFVLVGIALLASAF